MYCQHFGLREMPFRMPPQAEYFYTGAARGDMLQTIQYAILHQDGIIKVSGEVGTGKTMLCRMLLDNLPDQIIPLYLATPTLARQEMLCALARDLGISVDSTAPYDVTLALSHRLIDLHAANKKVVLIVDEAHAMPLDALEEIRLLSNLETKHHKLLQIVLFGQDELDDMLEQGNMRALRERISLNFYLSPFKTDDVASYLQFRLNAAGYHGGNIFQPAAIRLISKYSVGLTRRINLLADKALLAAFAEHTKIVTPKHVRLALQDAKFVRLPNQVGWQRFVPYVMAVMLVLCIACGVVWWHLRK